MATEQEERVPMSVHADMQTSAETAEVGPAAFHQTLCPPVAEPPFSDPSELEHVWGRAWGAHDEVGRLRVVLVRRPGPEFRQIDAGAWNPAAQALVDPAGGWYWTSRTPPDLDRIREQHDGLIAALRTDGVEVVTMDALGGRFVKSVYTRDPLTTVPGGAIVGRLAPAMRRGEELSVLRELGRLGVPVLRTIVGRGMFEGGSFVKLRPGLAAFGTSIRCNEEAAEQLRETLRWLGIELLTVPLSGYSIHLDGHLAMLAPDKALVNAPGLPFWFLERLRELEIEVVHRHPDERWAVNCLVLRPGRVLMSDDCARTAERLERRGIEVIPLPYDEIQKNGGGIHCSTMELLREPA
jgi:N-dimethylarginine dimethylaminohydrolase